MVAVLPDKISYLVDQDARNILILPPGRLATRHKPDAADAVNDGSAVLGIRFHLKHLGILQPRRQMTHLMLVTDRDGVIGLQVDHLVVLDKYRRHTVQGRRDDESIIKSRSEEHTSELQSP